MNILEYENYQEKKVHTEADFPYNTYLCSIPLDFDRVPIHWHDYMEIIYIKKGHGYVTVDLKQYKVSGSTIVLILPGQLHSIEQYDDLSMEYENIFFNVNMFFTRTEDTTVTDFLRPLLNGKVSVPTVFTSISDHYDAISACIDACDEICKTKPEGYDLYIKGKLFEFFYVLSNRCREVKTTHTTKSLDKMKIIMKHVENHYMEKITIADIAEVAGFSESHFMRYFKETMGVSFVDYLRRYRLTMATRLLLASDASILSISEEVGFDNLSYFNRAFKKEYGMTPSRYRKQEE
jgi:AraC-like DNA-binding protein/mannose-6-phosphate isomerase-like protein (cupin superfamily)